MVKRQGVVIIGVRVGLWTWISRCLWKKSNDLDRYLGIAAAMYRQRGMI